MSKELYSNLAVGFLSGAITSTATSVTLSSSTMFPSTGNFTVKCDQEIMLVTANASNVLTVTRGQEGTTAASHADTAPIFGCLTDGSLRRLARQSKNGTLVSQRREINFIEGTNVTLTMSDDGTNDKVDLTIASSGGGGSSGVELPFTAPVLADFAWINQGSATATLTAGGGLYLTCPGTGGVSVHAYAHTTTGNFTLVTRVTPQVRGQDNGWPGVGVRDPVTGTSILLVFVYISGVLNIVVNYGTGDGYTGGANKIVFPCTDLSGFKWVKVVYDGTNIIFYAGPDGYSWMQIWSEAKGTVGTPTQAVVITNPNSTSSYAYPILVSSWQVTNP